MKGTESGGKGRSIRRPFHPDYYFGEESGESFPEQSKF
jgi:hypothetical protein